MKVLVVGSVPPPIGGRRDSLLAHVLELRDGGHDVEIVSPDGLSAAHRHLTSTGVPGAVEIALAARHADAVVVQVEPGLPMRPSAGRGERAVTLLSLAAALRRTPEVTIRLDHLDDLPGGPGGRAALELWKSASRIEVGDEAVLHELSAALGPMADRVVLSRPREVRWGDAGHAAAEWGEGADTTAEAVTAVVRRRAATERAAIARRADRATRVDRADRLHRDGGSPPEAERVALWEWLPWPGAGAPDLDAAARSPAGRRSLARRLLVPMLAAAERRPLTRPLALAARGVWGRLKAPVRP